MAKTITTKYDVAESLSSPELRKWLFTSKLPLTRQMAQQPNTYKETRDAGEKQQMAILHLVLNFRVLHTRKFL